MNKKIRKTFAPSPRKTSVFFTRPGLFALAALLFAVIAGATTISLLPTAHAGMSDGEAIKNQPAAPAIKNREQNVWQSVERRAVTALTENLPEEFTAFRLDKAALASILAKAPHESLVPLSTSETGLKLPFPDGTLRAFRIQEAPVLEPSLAARFPEIKSYRALAIDDAGTTARFDLTPQGFHATILTPDKTFSILPADDADESLYASYDGAAQLAENNFFCALGEHQKGDSGKHITDVAANAPQASVGSTLRTYRVAISATYEYSRDLGGGTLAGTLASINTWLNATNAIYERDLAIRLIMVDATNVIFTNSNDPYTDEDGVGGNPPVNNISVLEKQVRTQLRDNVGVNNFNVGHLFARNQPGGAAGLGVVCHPASDADGPFKANGVTGLVPASGNLASLQVLAHEFGHQFNAPHNFNSKHPTCAGNDGNNRIPHGAFEPGAGNTIMAYPNRCGDPNANAGDNVIGFEYLRFHSSNFAQINDHVINGAAAGGTVCFTAVNTGNTPPTVSAGANYTIPKLTPFTLTATGSDPDTGDQNNLTYTWEQYQAGGADFFQNATAASYTDLNDPINTTRPIFRAMPATTNPSRTFPSLTYILNNQNDPPDMVLNTPYSGLGWTAEELPRVSRTLVFRVTARDTVGGVSDSTMTATVDGNAGPFTVNDVNGPWTGGTLQAVTWNVNNTSPLAANVRISLSTDGGQSFPITLAPSTPNDGSENVNVPNGITTSAARIKVEAIGNVFFDITGANFSIAPGGTCPVVNDITPKVAVVGSQVEITGIGFTGANAVAFGGVNAPTFTVNSDTKITVTVPTGATGGPITVSEPGCSVAESSNFTVCSGTTTEISVDDGSMNSSRDPQTNQTGYFVTRLKPTSYPATLSEVRLYFPNFINANTPPGGDGHPLGTQITVLSAANANGSTNINNTNFKTRSATITTHNNFVSYPIEPITITKGEFIVGYSISGLTGRRAIARDNTAPIQNSSYFHISSNFNGTFVQETDANYMIRAAYYSGACSAGDCSDVISISDNTIEGYRGGTTGQTGYYVNRLTPTSYPATLSQVRIYFQSFNGYPVGTSINLLSAANPTVSTSIDNVSFNTQAATITGHDGYVTYSIAPITITSGDFLVGYSIVHQGAQFASIAHDTGQPIQGRSYTKDNGAAGYSVESLVNHPIRAGLFSDSCSSGCTYTVTPTSQSFSSTGGSGTISVTTQAGCPWTASRGNYWIAVNSNTSIWGDNSAFARGDFLTSLISNAQEEVEIMAGTGSGSATFTVAPNNGTARTGTITVAGQTFTVTQTASQPTASSVSINGRVTANNRSVAGARVTLINTEGESRTAQTNSFGYYRFEEVPAGETYVVSVHSKRYNFTPQVISVTEEIENLNFTAQ